MIKILYYKDHLRKVGGIERIWINKMNYLSEDPNFSFYVITNTQEGFKPAFPLSSKVTHIDLNICLHHAYKYPKIIRPLIKTWKNILFYFRLQKTINQIDPDFIVIDSTYDPMIFRMKHHAKIIAESHTARSFIHVEKKDAKRMFYHYENKADIVVSLTEGEAKEWKKAKQVEIIPNFIEKQPEPKLPEKEYKRVISSGRLVLQKRQEDLIKAWGKVASVHPDWRLDIYGKGERHEFLQNLIISYELQDYITIYPPTDRMMQEFQESDFFVLSSLYEGFALVIAEAMMEGRPCVSYDCPYGPSELIDHMETGLLVDSCNIEELANSINWMIEHPDQRLKMGKKAYYSIQKFTPDFIIPKWKLFYLENLKKQQG